MEKSTVIDASKLLKYLSEHLLGSRSGLAQFQAAVETWSGTDQEAQMVSLKQQVAADQRDLKRIMDAMGYHEPAWSGVIAPVAHLAGKINPFNPWRGRKMSLAQVQLDVLTGLLNAKLRMWRTLDLIAPTEPRLDRELLADLTQRAESQIGQITTLSDETWADRFSVSD